MVANVEKLREALNEEKDPEVMWKLSFISLVAGGMKLEGAIAHFGIGIATGYKWVRRWNSEGVEGLRRKKIPGRPPKLSTEELEELRRVLKAKPYWSVKEVMRLIKELFRVNYSDEQIRRILVEKLGMNYAKPFVRDYRRPKDAEVILAERVEGAIKNLKDRGYKDEDIVIGFLDEASPQNQANTVRVLSFGKPRIFKKYGQDES
ncbi:MAG: IS630 family transposase [Candidatus Methanoperedens sp.]|nr:IS630 family transposase [Candidatus Methanoperedens sp.]